MYLTYQSYVERGGTLQESKFNYIEGKAEKKLDYFTHYRIKGLSEVPKEVEDVIFEFVMSLENSQSTNGNIAAYSNGIESFTFDNKIDPFVNLYSLALEYLDIDLISAAVD